jgi:quercetin dioxygenase-like cupin family protein
VLSGAISYRIDEEIYDLGADEYLHFRSDIPHSWENAIADETRVLWVFSDGLSF